MLFHGLEYKNLMIIISWHSVIFSFFSGLILLYLSLRIHKQKKVVGYSLFWIILLLYAIICLTFTINSLGILFPGLGSYPLSKPVYLIYFSSFYLLPVGWILYCIYYTGKMEYITASRIGLLLVIPVMMILIRIDEFWKVLPFFILQEERVIWYQELLSVGHFYLYALILCGVILLVQKYHDVSFKFRRQILFFIVGIMIPIITELISDDNFLPCGFDVAISGLFLAFGVLYYNVLEHSPVFREKYFNILDVGLLTLNQNGEILDMNPVAESYLCTSLKESFSRQPSDIDSIPEEFKEILKYPENTQKKPHFFVSYPDIRWFSLSSQWIAKKINADGAFLIAISDITKNVNLEQEITHQKIQAFRKSFENEHDTRYLEFFRSSRDAIFILSGKTIIACNPVVLDLFGKEETELVGKDITIMSAPVQIKTDDVLEKLQFFIAEANSQTPVRFSWIFTGKDSTIQGDVVLRRFTYDDQGVIEMCIRDQSASCAQEK